MDIDSVMRRGEVDRQGRCRKGRKAKQVQKGKKGDACQCEPHPSAHGRLVRGLRGNSESETNVLEERDSDGEMGSAIMHATDSADRDRDRGRGRGAATAWRLWFGKTQ